MSIKLKTKSSLFKILDHLPENIGYPIYHFIQDLFNDKNFELTIKRAMPTYQSLEKIAKDIGLDLKHKTILEIGSGWLPVMPYFFKFLSGADKIKTYDLNRHYKRSKNLNFNEIFKNKFQLIMGATSGKYALPQEIEYYPNSNIIDANIGEPDVIFSRFVLEHVTPEDLKGMHKKFKKDLKPGSWVIHFISPSDHRAYVDKTLSLQDFLKYSQEEWNSRQTKFDYHNRWRLPQYLKLFKELDFEIVYLDHDLPPVNSPEFQKFIKLKVHEDFNQFTTKELMAGSIIVVLKI